jgi:hypothetical protein
MSDPQQQAFERSMRRAQIEYDNQEPPDSHTDEDGNCEHKWRRVGEHDGTTYIKCRICGAEDET